ncbi:MAG: T9SS type A sorting domain-containing protein [Candidatus Marinimicrobia bacterium]|nr:T9SS type A sorting domain-containing protein [Candidatus Neomarinimicrobiota bacterium]
MFRKELFFAILLFTVSIGYAEKAVLGPDIQKILPRDGRPSRINHIQVNPKQKAPDFDPHAEVQPLLSRDKSFTTIDPDQIDKTAFTSRLEYVNWPTGGFGGFGFDATDSALTWFRPAAECSIEQVHIAFGSDSDWSGKTAKLQLYSIKEDWDSTYGGNRTYDFSQFDYIVGENGPHDQLLWEATFPVTDLGMNNLYTLNLADWGGPVEIGCDDFALVIGIPAEVSDGMLYYSPFWSDRGQYHSFKYYHGAAGWKSRLNFVMMATVDYYDELPPFISNENDLSDVYYSDDPGPYLLEMTIPYTRFYGCHWEGALSTVLLKYSVNGVPYEIDVSDQIVPVEGVENHFQVELSGLSVGDHVEYFWWAADTTGISTHEITSALPMSFTVREANPDASIFIMDDNSSKIAADYYAPILHAGGWIYDYWDVASSGTPTAGILSNYAALIWVQGSERAGILADSSMESILRDYLDSGRSLFLSSSDYIGEMEGNFDGVWYPSSPGSFLESHLHVAQYVPDANIGTVSGVSDDTLYTGVAGSIISDDYSDIEFVVNPSHIGYNNWADEVTPDKDAEAPFLVYSNYLDQDWVSAGVVYDGAYKVVFLPWQFEAIVDREIQADLLRNILAFLAPDCHGYIHYEGGNRNAQAANAGDILVYGSPFYGGGDELSMSIKYTLDDGATWSSAPMTDGVGAIPALSVGDTCTFRISVDDPGWCSFYSETHKVWKIDFTPSADILYVGDDYYTWHYGANYDSVNYARTVAIAEAAGFTIEYYDLDEFYLMDSYSILDQYTAVIWNGYGDWDPACMPVNTFDNPLTEYVAQGGHLLYSSEEMIGTWFDWPQYQEFEPGQFMYDVLRVNWAANDFGNDSIAPDPTGVYTSELDTFNLASDNFFWGNMNDICDPIGYWGTGGTIANPSLAPFTSYGPEQWGWSPNSSMTENTTFLAFSMMMIPDAQYTPFIGAWLGRNVAVDEPVSSLPEEFALSNNYPNPFNPVTHISYELPQASDVTVTVYDLLGRNICTLVEASQPAGYYQIQWNSLDDQGEQVSTGIYFARLQAEEFSSVVKMVYLR